MCNYNTWPTIPAFASSETIDSPKYSLSLAQRGRNRFLFYNAFTENVSFHSNTYLRDLLSYEVLHLVQAVYMNDTLQCLHFNFFDGLSV